VAEIVRTFGGGGVQVIGLREFRLAMRNAEAKMPTDLRLAMNEIANELLVPTAIGLIRKNTKAGTVYTGNRKPGKLAKAVKAASTTYEGRVQEGASGARSRTQYAGWWEFGGSTKSPIWGKGTRKTVQSGRALYPALVHRRKEIWEAMDLVLTRFAMRIDAMGGA
jgi:hypothetical protein